MQINNPWSCSSSTSNLDRPQQGRVTGISHKGYLRHWNEGPGEDAEVPFFDNPLKSGRFSPLQGSKYIPRILPGIVCYVVYLGAQGQHTLPVTQQRGSRTDWEGLLWRRQTLTPTATLLQELKNTCNRFPIIHLSASIPIFQQIINLQTNLKNKEFKNF